MEWKAEYSVALPEIDKDHQILVDCMTEIEEAISKRESVQPGIAKLAYLSRTHFSAEETLMRAMGYSDIDAHVQEHKRFLTDLKALGGEAAATGQDKESVARLKAWLENHFLSDDRQYASLLSKENKEYVRKYYL